MELGEDWRIESTLLSQEIQNQLEGEQQEHTSFNLFNQFLWCFLKGKVNKQNRHSQLPESQIQDAFMTQLDSLFLPSKKIQDSLAFKTLSLGFFITVMDLWKTTFRPSNKILFSLQLFPIGTIHTKPEIQAINNPIFDKNSSIGTSTIRHFDNLDLASCHLSMSEIEEKKKKISKKWTKLESLDFLTPDELRAIKKSIQKYRESSSNEKVVILSMWAVNNYRITTKDRNVRVLCLSNQFYATAFLVWIIFNIKLFFSMNFSQFLHYFKKLREDWHESHQRVLKKVYLLLEKQWGKLLKDYSVALHDDEEVLKSLIKRFREELSSEWKNQINQITKKIDNL